MTHRVLASTTSHKREPLLRTLEVFACLGLRDLDLNLHHFIELGASPDAVAEVTARGGQRVWVVSGGWCDFFHEAPRIDETMRSIDRQVAIGERLGTRMLRLFFGRLARDAYDARRAEVVAGNLRRLSDRHQDTRFVFENHDGATLVPEVCRDILARVDRPNIRMNFDPINFAHAGVDPDAAATTVQPFVAHMHLKGLDRLGFCEFGTGDVDLTPLLQRLLAEGYTGDFTVEYEGPFDGTLRLHQSVERARRLLAAVA
jgi:sugar phosphate isomerase/epimerase